MLYIRKSQFSYKENACVLFIQEIKLPHAVLVLLEMSMKLGCVVPIK